MIIIFFFFHFFFNKKLTSHQRKRHFIRQQTLLVRKKQTPLKSNTKMIYGVINTLVHHAARAKHFQQIRMKSPLRMGRLAVITQAGTFNYSQQYQYPIIPSNFKRGKLSNSLSESPIH